MVLTSDNRFMVELTFHDSFFYTFDITRSGSLFKQLILIGSKSLILVLGSSACQQLALAPLIAEKSGDANVEKTRLKNKIRT